MRPWPAARPSVLLLLAVAACGGDEPAEEAARVPEAVPQRVEPLNDDDLAGLDPAKVSINMPWGGGVVSRDPAPSAARATIRDARTVEHEAFDRLVLEVGPEAPFPGYRVAWADSTVTRCGTTEPLHAGDGPRPLLVRLQPAQAHEDDGTATIRERERRTGFPAMAAARLVCDEGAQVEWLLEVSDSTAVRVLEMRDPPRLIVDVAHPGTGVPAPTSPTTNDTAGAASPGAEER